MTTQSEKTITSSAMAALAAIRNRDVSAEELTKTFQERIEAENANIGALSNVMAKSALKRAKKIDEKLGKGEAVGPLAGLPFVVKENCDIEGISCSAGLNFRNDHIPHSNAWITQKLIDSGAILIGQSVSDPGAFDVKTEAVTHPIDPKLSVGGSSGGSAAALAANMALGAIGTDTGGSIRIPAACCGIVGLKPTFGALPMDGIFPLVQSLDHVGPMARSVEDVDLIWSAISNQQPSQVDLPKSVGIDPKWIDETDVEIQKQTGNLLTLFSDLGIEVVEIEMPDLNEICDMHMNIFVVENAAFHLAHYSEHRERYPPIAKLGFDLIDDMSVGEYVRNCKLRVEFTEQINQVFENTDLLINPTLGVHQPVRAIDVLTIAGVEKNFTAAMVRHTCLFDHTGHPTLAMPMGSTDSTIPSSIQLIGKFGKESDIMNFGKVLEQTYLKKM